MKIRLADVTEFENEVKFSKICQVTGELHEQIVDKERYLNWKRGMLISDAFPPDIFDSDYREFILKPNWTPAEWDSMFNNEEE